MAAQAKTLARSIRWLTDDRHAVGAFITKFGADNVGMLAAFVSWSILTSLVPIVVGIAALSTLFLHDPSVQRAVVDHLSNALQGVLSPQDIQDMVTSVLSNTGLLAVIGFVGVFWGSSNVGGSIATAFQAVFETAGRPFLKEKLIDLGMLPIMTATLLLVVAGSLASAYLNQLLGVSIPQIVQFCIGAAIAFAAAFMLFASIYSVLPNIEARYKQGNVWRGALLAASLFLIVSYVWPLYVRISHFSRYSAFLFSLLVLTAWIYLFAIILMVGAEIVAISSIREAQRHGESVGPPPQGTLPQHWVLRKRSSDPSADPTAGTPDGAPELSATQRGAGSDEELHHAAALFALTALLVAAMTVTALSVVSRRKGEINVRELATPMVETNIDVPGGLHLDRRHH